VAVPEALGLAEAGAVPEVFLTAWDALVVQGGLTSGRTALVRAGASGVGTAAIQIVKALAGTVVVTASAGKLDACRDLGADVAVDRSDGDVVAACRELTDGRGVDVVLDVVGGDDLDENVKALAVGGTIVQVGVMGGGRTNFNLGALLPKRATLRGTVLRSRPLEEKLALTQRFAREVVPLFADGRLRPVIDRRFPLAEVAAAHEVMESNANVGKLVLDVTA
jgi:NADPH:quinone reductase-like Zn-dependent oxidoreductase